MTKLVEQAIEKIPELLDADQDDAAELLLIVSSRAAGPEKLDKAIARRGARGICRRHAEASLPLTRRSRLR